MGGQNIRDTVEAYEEYARRNNEPGLDFVLACNEDIKPNPLNIRIGELGIRKDVAFAVGAAVGIVGGPPSCVDKNGQVRLTARSSKEFFNLDSIILKKSIKIL